MRERNEVHLLMYQKPKAPKRLLNSVHLKGRKRFQNCEWKIKSNEWQFLCALNCLLASTLHLFTCKSIAIWYHVSQYTPDTTVPWRHYSSDGPYSLKDLLPACHLGGLCLTFHNLWHPKNIQTFYIHDRYRFNVIWRPTQRLHATNERLLAL